jgi:hypothetical protein
MKKLFIFALMFGIMIANVKAQSATQFSIASRAKKDTLTNADTLVKFLPATAGYNLLTLQLNVKKLSGTVAGKIIIEGSADNGSNYVTLTTANDTLTNTAGTKPYVFTYSPVYYTNYKVTVITSGTVSAVLLPYWTLKRFDRTL